MRSFFLRALLFGAVAWPWTLGACAAWAQLAPAKELAHLKASKGMHVSLFASEPMITNPTAIDVDTRGRVWVAEIQLYRKASKDRALEKIKVLEDTDHDGKADKMTVFAENVAAPMSICVAGTKVYIATSPDLWVYEDANGDLKADGPPKKLITGFGGPNHDHGAHSLVLGPDHKWWMAEGDRGFDVKGTDGSSIRYRWGAIMRGELDGSKLELVAVNFRNPYEVCVSSFGEPFCSDNDNDGNESVRICWIMEGGNYGWFGGPPPRAAAGTPFGEHWHFRGHMPGFVPATLVTGFGSPTGICFYEGDAFGANYKNAPLHTDAGPREVRIYRHTRSGAGMKAASEVFLSSAGDDYFRPSDICAGPEGQLYVADWYDGGVGGHAYNNPDQGRIFLVRPSGKTLTRQGRAGPYSHTNDAIEGLKNCNLATQYLARERLIASGQQSIPALQNLLLSSEPNYRARALWLLDRIGGQGRKLVLDQLRSADRHFRALAVRILRRHGDEYGQEIEKMASDPSPEVRREVLLGLAGLKNDSAVATIERLAAQYDGSDRYLLEAINIAAGDRRERLYAALEKRNLLTNERLPLLQLLNAKAASELMVARLTAGKLEPQQIKKILEVAGNSQSLETGRGLLRLLGNKEAPLELRRLAMVKLIESIQSYWGRLGTDDQFIATFKELLSEGPLRGDALAAVGNARLRSLGGNVLAMTQSSQLDSALRCQAIKIAARLRMDDSAKVLRGLLEAPDTAVRDAAIAGLIELQDPTALRAIVTSDKFAPDVRTSTVSRLAESIGGAIFLLRLIDENRLSADLKKLTIAKAVNHPDSNVRVLYEKFIPESERPKKLGASIQPEKILALAGDSRRGEAIFAQSTAAQCKSCHAVHRAGGTLGPDLTMIGKKYERKTLLDTILNPSKAIAPEYIPYLLQTEGGQVYAGFLVERSDKLVVLKDIQSNVIRVPAQEISALVKQDKSLMPELVLRDVTAQDAADLLAFLMTLK